MSMGVHQVLIDANVMSKFSTREEKANYSKCGANILLLLHTTII